MSVNFTLDDWEYLSGADKRAIVKLRGALYDFEPLANLPGIGTGMIGSLMAKELAEAGPCSRPAVAERGYRLTKKGWLASEWINGNRMAVYPESEPDSALR
jgi:hypothetical protein